MNIEPMKMMTMTIKMISKDSKVLKHDKEFSTFEKDLFDEIMLKLNH